MNRRHFLGAAVAALASAAGARAAQRQFIRIGLLNNLFRDISNETRQGSINHFQQIMERDTGYQGESVTVADLGTLARQLAEGKEQLGVCQGFEFAWLQPQYPNFRPLVVAVNQQPYVRAYLVVGANSRVTDFAGLQGKTLAIPKGTKEFCRLFVERRCQELGQPLERFFAKVTQPESIEDGIDDAVDGKADAVVADTVGLQRFRVRKPARHQRLRELARSIVFPPTPVIYQAGSVEQDALDRSQRALLNLNQNPTGRQVLLEWKLSAFEPVPRDYETVLQATRKVYPPPKEAAPK